MAAVAIQPPVAGLHLLMPSRPSLAFDTAALEKSWEILSVIHRYRTPAPEGVADRSDEGDLKFLSLIYGQVRARREIQLILPAFPFKSPNRKHKTLGALPDKGEELAMAHLNGLCAAIMDIYEPGAILTIASDGLVYNDLLGVSDSEVYAYGEALRQLAQDQGFRHIQFIRLRNLLHWKEDGLLDAATYERLANDFRQRLLETYTPVDYDVAASIKSDNDVCATYRGYIKFLTKDLEHTFVEGGSKKAHKGNISGIAKLMLSRGKAFAEAIRTNFPQHVRLSIHPSCGSTKISIRVLPQARNLITPWHSVPCFTIDGRVEYGMRETFDNNSEVELVSRDGRPWYYRYKSDLYSWSQSVEFEPLYPCGMMIRPTRPMSAEELPMHPLRELAQENSPLLLRAFQDTKDRELHVRKAEEMGTPLPWKFGLILEVKDHGTETQGLNNVLSSEWMPFHYDGLFKIKKEKDSEGKDISVSYPPKFQFFTGMTPSPKDTGFTLFSPSHLVWHYLPTGYTVEQLEKLRWTVETVSFDQAKVTDLPLVVPHFAHQRPCLRYHEPWPQEKTVFDPTKVTVQDVPDSAEVCRVIDSLLHDRRVALWHAWEEGDWLISDNFTVMHTRSSFTGKSDRCLRRIHVD
ncbi:putative pyoverdine/dityrosine biosynthesis protein [Aspergillus sclerotiicarbonarius CBS 121057]|uniref:Putative pyoverdine/dityrosine biosynthesis protein n=1 Tax=Aspergillus sclerotiicarbonarius (strain CBS 121057 / IBT 28362) TaxID=1448318 RepID=A0A319FJI5_ASPSB|nr:putative pyoverdine/dityrosine biosynthesis protein [Aspergillus sclerotiicarbonarius CBS 121057]